MRRIQLLCPVQHKLLLPAKDFLIYVNEHEKCVKHLKSSEVFNELLRKLDCFLKMQAVIAMEDVEFRYKMFFVN